MTFQTLLEWTKRWNLIILFFITKSDFLLIVAGTITPKVSINRANFGKRHYSLSKIMNNKQVPVYRLLGSTNDLRSIFVGHIYFKKLMIFRKFIEIFRCCITRLKNKKYVFFQSYLLIRTTVRKKNMGQLLFKKPFESHNFSEMFYCGMTRLRITNLSVFIQCQYTRTISRDKKHRT